MSQIANAKISVIREHDYSSEPGFVLSSFSGRETMTLSKGFPGPILIPWALWIVIALQTLNGIDVTEHHFLSQRMVVGLIGTCFCLSKPVYHFVPSAKVLCLNSTITLVNSGQT